MNYRKKRAKKLRQFAKRLETKLPKSEVWFRALYKEHQHKQDKFNTPLKDKYIPDIQNKRLRYVIEVDGSFHDSEWAKKKDRKKDTYYLSQGFKVFRVKAHCQESFEAFLIEFLIYREWVLTTKPWNRKSS